MYKRTLIALCFTISISIFAFLKVGISAYKYLKHVMSKMVHDPSVASNGILLTTAV